ncbi:MAG: hypothetical protein JNM84_12980 [Planctomycetes bacterium]|nr:hypothetical protein [Planctomycetota bacterium]
MPRSENSVPPILSAFVLSVLVACDGSDGSIASSSSPVREAEIEAMIVRLGQAQERDVAIKELGRVGAPAVPPLMRELWQRGTRENGVEPIMNALVEVGPPAIAALDAVEREANEAFGAAMSPGAEVPHTLRRYGMDAAFLRSRVTQTYLQDVTHWAGRARQEIKKRYGV